MSKRIGDLINAQERTELHRAIDAALEELRQLREVEEMTAPMAYDRFLKAQNALSHARGIVTTHLFDEVDELLASKAMR